MSKVLMLSGAGWLGHHIANKLIEKQTDGKFEVQVAPLRARVVFVGPGKQAWLVSQRQEKLLATDLSPVKFTVGPKTLSEPPLPTVDPAPDPAVGEIPDGVAAHVHVTVRNGDPLKPRLAEPIIIPADALSFRLSGTTVSGVRLKGGVDVQWDDLDGNGRLSSEDEIVCTWQS